MGQITVPTSRLKKLRSQGSFAVLKKHEKIALTTRQPGDITLSSDVITVVEPNGVPEPVALKDLDLVLDKSTYDKEITGEPGIWYGWQGSIVGGVDIVESTTTGQSYRVGINLFRAIPTVPDLPARSRTMFNLTENYGKLTTPVIPQTTPTSAKQVAKVNIFDTNFEHSSLNSRPSRWRVRFVHRPPVNSSHYGARVAMEHFDRDHTHLGFDLR